MKFVKNLGKMLLVAFAIVAYQPSVFAATQNAQPAKSQSQQLAQDDQGSSSSDQGKQSQIKVRVQIQAHLILVQAQTQIQTATKSWLLEYFKFPG